MIRRVSPVFVITTVAGTVTLSGTCGTSAGDGGPATLARVTPTGVAGNGDGGFWVSDTGSFSVRFVSSTNGFISLYAGTGFAASGSGTGYSGQGGPGHLARLNGPSGVTMDGSGNIVISDSGTQRVRVLLPNGTMSATALAGTGTGGFLGTGGAATSAQVNSPQNTVFDASGSALIVDASNRRILRVSGGIVMAVAGNRSSGYAGDFGPATGAMLSSPATVALSSDGSFFIVDLQTHSVRQVFVNSTIITIVGNGTAGLWNEFGLGKATGLSSPSGILGDNAGGVIIADMQNRCVRRYFASNASLVTVVGKVIRVACEWYAHASLVCLPCAAPTFGLQCGANGFSGDGFSATSPTARIGNPRGLCNDGFGAGGFYVGDSFYNNIRWVMSNGTIITVAGGFGLCFSGYRHG